MIYLDYTANTPADPDVLDAYLAAERRYIANPNSTHIAGQEARAEMERVTQSIAQHLGVQPGCDILHTGLPKRGNGGNDKEQRRAGVCEALRRLPSFLHAVGGDP